MARDDILIIAAVVLPVVAYAGNIGGFRTWADNALKGGNGGGGFGPVKPNCTMLGTNCQVCENPRRVEWKGTCKGKTEFLHSNTFSTNISFQQACSQVAKDFVAKCNAGQTSISKCTYPGCTNLAPGPGCFQCRCSNFCKSHPNTYAVTDATGSCHCRPLASAKQAFAYPGFDNVSIA